jgi:putative dehydrogenase
MSAEAITVGIVGLGIMGSAFSRNLIAKGFRVIGYDVDQKARTSAAEAGVVIAESPRAVGEQVDCVLSSLPNPAAFHAVMTGPDGLSSVSKRPSAASPGLIVVDTCTLTLEDKMQAYDAMQHKGITLLDAPISGTGAQAARADLVILASGDSAAIEKIQPVFMAIGRVAHDLGAFGNGSKMKYVANLLVTIHNVSSAEAFAFGMKSGIAPETIYKVLCGSAGSSRMFEVRGPKMVEANYTQEVSATHRMMVKDISIITDHAQAISCPTPLFSLAANIHAAAVAMGHEAYDTASVCAVLEELCGIHRTQTAPGKG